MRTILRAVLLSSVLAKSGGAFPASPVPAAAAGGEVRIDMAAASGDRLDDPGATAPRREGDLLALAGHLKERLAMRLPAGHSATVIILDVDRSGRHEWWRAPGEDRVRIVRDAYPPRIDLEFTLRGPDGSFLREGRRRLSDVAFLALVPSFTGDPLRFEKALMDDWIERELQPPRR